MATYIAKAGDTLMDVCYNTTGSLRALNEIINANGFDTYTPSIAAGQVIEVPDVVYNSEAVLVANTRAFNSTSIPDSDLNDQIELLEYLTGEVGKITYTFNGKYIAGKHLTLNLSGNNSGYVRWGDGSKITYYESDTPPGHTYGNNIPDVVEVIFLGITDTFYLTPDFETQRTFKEGLIKVDITHASNCNITRIWKNAFWGCLKLEEVVGTFAGTNIINAYAMFKSCYSLITIPSGMFMGCADLTDIGNCFNECYKLLNGDDLAYNCKSLTQSASVFLSCTSLLSANRAFCNCANVITFENTFRLCSRLISATDVFKGCTSAVNMSRVMAECRAFNPPVDIFNDCKSVTNFYGSFFNNIAATNESPYTLVNKDKVKMWQRNSDYGYSKPTLFALCFGNDEKMADYNTIPEDWGGPIQSQTNIILLLKPMMEAISSISTVAVHFGGETIEGVGAMLSATDNSISVTIDLPIGTTSVEGLYVTIFDVNRDLMGASFPLPSTYPAPTKGAIYTSYYNSANDVGKPSIFPIFAPDDPLTPALENAIIDGITYSLETLEGDMEAIGTPNYTDISTITHKVSELGWDYYYTTSNDLYDDLVTTMNNDGIDMSTVTIKSIIFSISVNGMILSSPKVAWSPDAGCLMPIVEFTYT